MSTYSWDKSKAIIGIGKIDEFRGQARVKGNQLAYGYKVNGKEFISNRIYAPVSDNLIIYQVCFNDQLFVQNNYNHGELVDVYFNPRNPEQACLKQGGSKYILIESAIWLVFYLMFLTV